jgi:phenylacetate-CoA ligase
LFRNAYDKSPFYKELYKNRGIRRNDIKGLEDLERLPIITKEDILKQSEKLLTVSRNMVIPAHTSGTTGTSLRIYQGLKAIWKEQAYVYTFRHRCGFKYGDNLVSLRGHLDCRTFSAKTLVGNILFLSSFQIRKENAYRYQKMMSEQKPKAIEGYPSSLYNLACIFREMGIKMEIPLCFTSSETLFDFQRKVIGDVFGCDIYDWYGCTEKVISLAESVTHAGYYEMPGYSINEYRDDCIIATSLINNSFPLIRYKIDDIVTLKPEFDGNDILKPTVERIEGRTDSYIVTKDGSVIGRLDYLFKDVDNIKLAQIVQKTNGLMSINILPFGKWTGEQERKIIERLDHRVGLQNIDFIINIVDEEDIIYTSRNKFNQIIRSA